MADHHHHLFLVIVLLLAVTITGHDVNDAASLHDPHHDHQVGGVHQQQGDVNGEFSYICNPYEYDASYYTTGGEQEFALTKTTKLPEHQLGQCLQDSYGGTEPWFYHYASCSLFTWCAVCFEDAAKVIRRHCPNRVGAQAGSTKCFARYEPYQFC